MFLKRLAINHRIIKPLLVVLIVWGFVAFVLVIDLPHEKDEILNHRHDTDVIISENVVLKTFVTKTAEERSTGLSDHTNLNNDEAMLFVFGQPGFYGFHMPDMDFSIDIYWINEKKEIVYIKESAHPKDFPETYTPNSPALYVLEVVDGFTQKNKIQIGDTLSWQL